MAQKFFKITDKTEWQGFLDKALFKTFFHEAEWEEFLEKEFPWLRFEHYIWPVQGEGAQVLLSLARQSVPGLEKLISHPFCEYGGPLPLVNKINSKEFEQDLFSEFKNHIRISFHPQLLNYFQDVAESELKSSGGTSYWIEGVLNLRKTTRHEIEIAETQGFKIEKCQSQEDLKSFYNLHEKTAMRQNTPIYPLPLFQHFLNSPEAEVILAKKDDKVIAGSVFLFYDRFVHYFKNAADDKYKKFGVNYLILREQVNKALAQNKIFDLGGTRIDSPLNIFKRGWGGREVPIFELKNYKEKLKLKRSFLRHALGILPMWLFRKISPRLLKYKL